MTARGALLALRLARFELIAFGGAVLLASLAAIQAAARILSLAPPPACRVFDGTIPEATCAAAGAAWYGARAFAPLFQTLLPGLPLAAGLFLGVPLVARELERGTARLAWSLAPSRTSWLVTRLVPTVVVLGVISLVAGFAMDRLLVAVEPDLDLENAFVGFGFHGGLIASRAVFVFSLAVVIGAVLGRVLPAIILAAVIATVGLTGGAYVHQEILRGEAVPIDELAVKPGDLYVDQRFRLPDGSIVGYEHFQYDPPVDAGGNPVYPVVAIVVPGERFRSVEAREALALGAASLLACILAAVVVTRRRPT